MGPGVDVGELHGPEIVGEVILIPSAVSRPHHPHAPVTTAEPVATGLFVIAVVVLAAILLILPRAVRKSR